MAEVVFFVALVGVPLVAGALLAHRRKPWWWGAVAAVLILFLLAVVPPPEEGEPRLAAGDIPFLLTVGVIAAVLAWLGAFLARRSARRRLG